MKLVQQCSNSAAWLDFNCTLSPAFFLLVDSHRIICSHAETLSMLWVESKEKLLSRERFELTTIKLPPDRFDNFF